MPRRSPAFRSSPPAPPLGSRPRPTTPGPPAPREQPNATGRRSGWSPRSAVSTPARAAPTARVGSDEGQRWPVGTGRADAAGGSRRGGWPILARAPGEDGSNAEKDNPQEPRPGDGRADPPAPGRLAPGGHQRPEELPRPSRVSLEKVLVLRPEGRVNLTAATAGGATHRPAVRRPDPSALLAGTPTRISRSNRVGPSGQLSAIGAHEATVKATFPLARRICPAQDGRITSIVLARLRDDPQTRAYAARRRSEGKSAREVRRCLKRVVARQLFKLLERYDRSEVEVLKAS